MANVNLGKFISADIQIGLNGISTNYVVDYMSILNPSFSFDLSVKLGGKARVLFLNITKNRMKQIYKKR